MVSDTFAGSFFLVENIIIRYIKQVYCITNLTPFKRSDKYNRKYEIHYNIYIFYRLLFQKQFIC